MAERIGAQLYIEGDKQFKNALREVNSEIKANSTLLKDLGTQYDKNDKKLADHRRENEQLNRTIESSKSKVKTLTSEYTRQSQELIKLERNLDEAKQRYGENSAEASKAESAVSKQTKAVNDLESQINTTNTQINEFNQRLRENANTATYAGEKITAAGEKMSSIGNTLTVGVTLPLVALGTSALKVAVDFEQGMSNVQAISGATGGELEKLRDQAIDLGESTAFSSAEVAEAMTEMAKAGWDTQSILDGMSGVLDAAAASGEGLASVSTIVADSITGFGLAASDSARVADVLTYAANAGTIGIEDLGETFKYIAPVAKTLGFTIEDVTTATAAMSMAGIKGSLAGTSLRTTITNLVKPTKSMAGVMEDLGLSVTDSDGNFKSLEEIVTMLRTSFSGLTEEEKAHDAAILAGKEGMSGLLALLSTSQEEYDALSDAMENSAGVAKKTAEVMQDNLASKYEQFTGSLESMSIKFMDLVLPTLTKGTEAATGLIEKFSEMPEESKKSALAFAGIAAAAGPVTKVLGKTTEGLGKTITYLGETAKGLGKGTESTTVLSKVLKTAATPGGAFVIGATALAAVGAAAYGYYQHTQEIARKKDLEEHFGRVSLSMEEVEQLAKELTTTDWTMTLNTYIDAKDKLAESQAEIAATVADLNKYDWKVKAGFEVTADETESYKQSIQTYISQVQTYVQDKGYALSLAVDLGFGDSATGAGLSGFVDTYFTESHAELEDLGTQLADLVNESFENNTFAENRIKIDKIRQQMAEVMAEISKYDSDSERIKLEMDLEVDTRLDVESFKQTVAKTNETREEIKRQMQEAQKGARSVISMRYEMQIEAGVDKSVADKARQDAIDALQINLADEDAKSLFTGWDKLFGMIEENYSAEIEKAAPELQNIFKTNMDYAFSNFEMNPDTFNWTSFFVGFEDEFSDGAESMSNTTKKNIKMLLAEMEPQAEDFKRLAGTYHDLGRTPSEEIIKGLENTYQLQLMAGKTDNMYAYLGMQLGGSPEFLNMLETALQAGANIPEELMTGIETKYGLVYNATSGLFEKIKSGAQENAPAVIKEMNDKSMKIGDSVARQLAAQYGAVYNGGKWLLLNAKDGAYSVVPEVLNELAARGVEIPQSFIDAMQGQEPNVQAQAVDLLMRVAAATEEERPALLQQLNAFGVDTAGEYVEGLVSKAPEVGEVGLIFGDKLQSTIDSKPITTPRVDSSKTINSASDGGALAWGATQSELTRWLKGPGVDNGNTVSTAYNAAYAGRSSMQWYFDTNPIYANVRLSGASQAALAGLSRLGGYEDGGKVTKEELAWHAEGNKPEYVIPVSPAKRERGIELLEQAAADLNYPISQLATSRIGQYNYTQPAPRTRTRAEVKNEAKTDTPVTVETHINLDSREFAVVTAPAMRKELGF